MGERGSTLEQTNFFKNNPSLTSCAKFSKRPTLQLINLHLNSVYSFYSSLIDFETLIKKAREAGVKTLVLTDQNLCGALEFYRLCLAAQISPVLGLEVEVENRKCLVLARS